MRVIIALIIFSLTFAYFTDVYEIIPAWLTAWTVDIQFIPLFINATAVSVTALIILATIIALTLLFGRFYCSTVCPLGIYQDIVIRLKTWMLKKVHCRHKKPSPFIHYGLTAFTLILFFVGITSLLILLDPYSNFGRMVSGIIKPIQIKVLNFTSRQLQNADAYWLMPVNYTVVWKGIIYSGIFMVFITVLSWKRGRLFCNLLCPAGGVLSLISRFSIFKLQMEQSTCTSCGKCMRACKAECISVKEQSIDFSRCISCYNCISSCEQNAITICKKANNNKEKIVLHPQNKRRELLKNTVGVGISLLAIPTFASEKERHKKGGGKGNGHYHNRGIVTPPGSISMQHFNDKCTSCHLCVAKCPSNVLQPTLAEFGMWHALQPKMNYNSGYCNFDCTICGEVCPTGAIQPLTKEQKNLCQVGKVHFTQKHCVVETEGTSCGSCSEHCPTQAVYMVPFGENLTIPEINEDLCVGCGACEHACPVTDPHKAIFVVSNSVHQVADKPKQEQVEVDVEEDFPF